jgi:predicted ATPase
VLWLLGYPDQARQRGQEALALGRELSHAFSSAQALYWLAWVHQQRGEAEAAQKPIEALLAIGKEHGFPRFVAQGTLLMGRLLVDQGQVEEGIVQMRQAAAGHPATLGRDRSQFFALMAEAFGKGGQIEEGLSIVTEELYRASKTGVRNYEAELHRIEGELLLQQAVPNEERAEDCFQQAIKVAQSQSAKSLELRAAMSLNRLWQKQGKKDDARKLLNDICGWFTEGFETADLKAAKALLNELT